MKAMVKCPNCNIEMKNSKDAYFDDDNNVIVIHDVFKCPKCGEILLSSEQMKKLTERLKTLGLWKEKRQIELAQGRGVTPNP